MSEDKKDKSISFSHTITGKDTIVVTSTPDTIEEAVKEAYKVFSKAWDRDWMPDEYEQAGNWLRTTLTHIQNVAEEKYNELLLAVGNKYEGETRHETALRYIQQAEQGNSALSATRHKGGKV